MSFYEGEGIVTTRNFKNLLDGGGRFLRLVMTMIAFSFYGLNGGNQIFLNYLRLEQS